MTKHAVKRIILSALIAGLLVTFWVMDLGDYLTLAHVKSSLKGLSVLKLEHSGLVILIYFTVYVAAAALSLPGAAVLTIIAGALFGFAAGTLIVSFASAIGATLACMISRFVLGDFLQARLGDRVTRINEGIEKEGAFYLFTLRLIPVFPFWVINLVVGLTRMPLWKFYWVSQAGMLAGTMIYVNAGRQFAGIQSFKGILSPGLITSLALLGVFPLAAKKFVMFYRRKKGSGDDQ